MVFERPLRDGSSVRFALWALLVLVIAPAGDVQATTYTFTLSGLRLDPDVAIVGEAVVVHANVSNPASMEGTATVLLLVDGAVRDSAQALLPPWETVNISFRYVPESVGALEVTVKLATGERLPPRTLRVEPAPVLRALRVQEPAHAGEPVPVEAVVASDASIVVASVATLLVDGVVTDVQRLELPPGGERVARFLWTPSAPATSNVSVNLSLGGPLLARTVWVLAPPPSPTPSTSPAGVDATPGNAPSPPAPTPAQEPTQARNPTAGPSAPLVLTLGLLAALAAGRASRRVR